MEQEDLEHFEEHLAAVAEEKTVETDECITVPNAVSEDKHAECSMDILTDRNAVWRKELRAVTKPKERAAIDRVVMPELEPGYRSTTRKEEVNKGLTMDMALTEAKR